MERKKTVKVLIIPDVHGRTFWKDCVEKFKEEIDSGSIDVVFLGDYVDPYPFEPISVENAIKNFVEICEYAKGKKNVHLLLGNHDMPYYDRTYCISLRYKCRYSITHAREIEGIFKKYKRFNIAWEKKINGKRILFSHAGVLKGWVERAKIEGLEPTAKSLNKLTHSMNGIDALLDINDIRGGYSKYGSVIWADVYEQLDSILEQHYYDDIYQVFGHTLSYPTDDNNIPCFDKYYIDEHFAMLDARRGFTMDSDGKIKEVK